MFSTTWGRCHESAASLIGRRVVRRVHDQPAVTLLIERPAATQQRDLVADAGRATRAARRPLAIEA